MNYRIKQRDNAPSITKTLNRGKGFKKYRHDYTNYDNVVRQIVKDTGERDSKVYMSVIARFVIDCLQAVKGNASHEAEITEYAKSKGLL